MTLGRALLGWIVFTVFGCVWVAHRAHIAPDSPPPQVLADWAMRSLEASRAGEPPPAAPARDHTASEPVIVTAWWGARPRLHHRGTASVIESVRGAVKAFAADALLLARPVEAAVHYTVTVPYGRAPLLTGIPYVSTLGIVPLIEGVVARVGERQIVMTPHELWARREIDRAVITPIPDLSFGMDLERLAKVLAERLEVAGARPVDAARLLSEGHIERLASHTLTAEAYPGDGEVTAQTLATAAREAAGFLLRHQRRDGAYAYRYDARRNRRLGGYNLPRHAGTTFFLAQAARVLEMPEARQGALRALKWIERKHVVACGDTGRCVAARGRAEMGGTALTTLAAAEILRGGEEPWVRELLVSLSAHIRAMQRADGELMHEYDVAAGRPIDVQRMYYSGEAAFALTRSHDVLGDERDLETVRRLMGHLTGAAWSFFGSRYFYGEEHWTCQAAAAASTKMNTGGALDFCLRWLDYQRVLQYRAGETPWEAEGAIGAGPVLLPRVTTSASRVEAGVPIYRLALARGDDVSELREQMVRSLRLLLRVRWSPGPVHLMRRPAAALGGMPSTQAGFVARNDFVQHAGSAMLAWLEHLRSMR